LNDSTLLRVNPFCHTFENYFLFFCKNFHGWYSARIWLKTCLRNQKHQMSDVWFFYKINVSKIYFFSKLRTKFSSRDIIYYFNIKLQSENELRRVGNFVKKKYFFERRTSYNFKAQEFINWRAFEFFQLLNKNMFKGTLKIFLLILIRDV